jgi:hypothetical protein
MTDAPERTSDLRVENALLRGTLFLTARALRAYHDAPHFEIDDDGIEKLEAIIMPSTREKAADALDRADKLLREPERGAGR